MILVIDGLTQLDDKEDAHSLLWLPAQLPAKVKVGDHSKTNKCLGPRNRPSRRSLSSARAWPCPQLIVSMNRQSRLHDLCVYQRRWRVIPLPPLSSTDQGMPALPPYPGVDRIALP